MNEEREGGFTLIELLIVMSIILMLSGFATLSLFGYRAAQDFEFDAERIVAAMRAAQQYSIVQEGGEVWGVCFHNDADPAQSDYYRITSLGVCPPAPGGEFPRVDLRGSEFTASVDKDKAVSFKKVSGLPDAQAPYITSVTIRERNGTRERTVSVDQNGVIIKL